MKFEEWAKSKGHPFHDLEPTFNGTTDRYSDIAREAWNAATLAELDTCAKVCDELKSIDYCVDVREAAAAIRAMTEYRLLNT